MSDAADGKFFDIVIPPCPGDTSGMTIAECHSVGSAMAIVRALLEAGKRSPEWIRIVPRIEMRQHD